MFQGLGDICGGYGCLCRVWVSVGDMDIWQGYRYIGDMDICGGYGYLWGIWVSVGDMDICWGDTDIWGDMDIWGAIIKPIITLHQLYSETIITKASQHWDSPSNYKVAVKISDIYHTERDYVYICVRSNSSYRTNQEQKQTWKIKYSLQLTLEAHLKNSKVYTILLSLTSVPCFGEQHQLWVLVWNFSTLIFSSQVCHGGSSRRILKN